ncbi:MAG: hypothetical protein EAX90_13570 [Candidatus Heimdallarchaeota archaeon]|nr:hypothetical protein [Candidatus Heimdallarchaeota archaeon]
MRTNKVILLSLVLLFISPIIALGATNAPEKEMIVPTAFDSPVLVEPGLTLKYDINALTLPSGILGDLESTLGEVTLPDLAGNQLYVKVMSVEEDVTLGLDLEGTLIRYAIGLIFVNDATFIIGEGFTALSITLPAGSTTPAIVMGGVPHFNVTTGLTPAFFFLNNDWTEHAAALQFGLGIPTTQTTDELVASYSDATSSLDATWRKSDGVLTELVIDNVNLTEMDLTGVNLDITLASEVTTGMNINVGDIFELKADIASLDISGSGDIYSLLEGNITSIETTVESLADKVILQYKVEEIEGLYYQCSVKMYNMDTGILESLEGLVTFNAFLGGFSVAGSPFDTTNLASIYSGFVEDELQAEMTSFESLIISLMPPVITADYDIYVGYMILLDAAVDIYLDDILDFVPTESLSGIGVNTIEGSFSFEEKRGYRFFNEYIGADITAELTDAFLDLTAQSTFALDLHAILNENGWLSYSEDNIIAGLRIKLDASIEVTSELGTLVSGLPTGAITIDLDIKLLNPEYKPPDPLGGGVIPGYTWIVAIPTLLGFSALGLISRRRK